MRRSLSRVLRCLLFGLTPGLLVIGVSGADPAYADAAGPVDVINFNGPCLDLVSGGVVIDRCDGGAMQDWRLVGVPDHSGVTLIRSAATGLCLDTRDHVPTGGEPVVLRVCAFDGSNRFQLWHGESLTGAFEELANQGDGPGLVMRPLSCTSPPGSPVIIAERSQCDADLWRPLAS